MKYNIRFNTSIWMTVVKRAPASLSIQSSGMNPFWVADGYTWISRCLCPIRLKRPQWTRTYRCVWTSGWTNTVSPVQWERFHCIPLFPFVRNVTVSLLKRNSFRTIRVRLSGFGCVKKIDNVTFNLVCRCSVRVFRRVRIRRANVIFSRSACSTRRI